MSELAAILARRRRMSDAVPLVVGGNPTVVAEAEPLTICTEEDKDEGQTDQGENALIDRDEPEASESAIECQAEASAELAAPGGNGGVESSAKLKEEISRLKSRLQEMEIKLSSAKSTIADLKLTVQQRDEIIESFNSTVQREVGGARSTPTAFGNVGVLGQGKSGEVVEGKKYLSSLKDDALSEGLPTGTASRASIISNATDDSIPSIPRLSSHDLDSLFDSPEDTLAGDLDPLGATTDAREISEKPLLRSNRKPSRKMDLPGGEDWGKNQKYTPAPSARPPVGQGAKRPSPGRKTTMQMMLGETFDPDAGARWAERGESNDAGAASTPPPQERRNSLFASVDKEEAKRKRAEEEAAKLLASAEHVDTTSDDGESAREVYSSTSTLFHISDSERNRGYRKFLDSLRDPGAAGILGHIKRFLMSVLMPQAAAVGESVFQNSDMDNAPLEERAKIWFEFMEDQFDAHPLWQDKGEKALIMAREGLEKYVMTKLFHVAFNEISLRVAADDEQFTHRRKVLQRFVTAEDLEVHPVCRSRMTVSLASNELNKLNSFCAPADKLQCIVRCCSFLFNQLSVSRDSAGSRPGADDFLPVLIYVVLNSNVPQMHANLEYIQNYRNSQDLMSKAGYCLVNLQSSVSFLSNVTGDSFPSMGTETFDSKFTAEEEALSEGKETVSPLDMDESMDD